MQISKWQARAVVTVVDGTNPVTMTLDVNGSKVDMDKIGAAIGEAVVKQLEVLGGVHAAAKAELETLRKKVQLLEEANAAEKAVLEAKPAPVAAPAKEAPRRGRPRKLDA